MSWTAVSGATSYQLNQGTNGGTAVAVYNGTGTSWSSSNLGNGSYAYQVNACNSAGCSISNQVTVTVTHPPGTPSLSVPSGTNSTGSYTVTWSGVSTATSYTLQEQVNGGAWSNAYSGSAISKVFSGKADGSYGYRVQACNAGGCSTFSTTGIVSVVHPPATAPTLSGPSSSTTGTYTLSWTAVTGATRYQLNQRVNGGAWSAVYNSTGRTWSSSALGNGSYAYQVYACNASGCGPVSNTVTVSVVHVPAAPGSVSAPSNANFDTAFMVSWSASTGATSYTLQQTDFNSGDATVKYTGPATGASVTVDMTGSYQYAVKACNSAGCSGWRIAPNLTVVGSKGGIGGLSESEPASGSSL